MDKLKRLRDLERFLSDNMDKEYRFDEIYKVLQSEKNIEEAVNSDSRKNTYLKNLYKTINDEAAMYQEKIRKKPNSNFHHEYYYFIKAFKQDVTDELGILNVSSKL